jgi:hypothetical protein
MPSLVKGIGGESSGALRNDCTCKLSRRVAPSSLQLVPYTLLKASPLMMLAFRASTLSHGRVIIGTTARTNSSKCVLKGILIQVLGMTVLVTPLFHCPPHVLDSSNVN